MKTLITNSSERVTKQFSSLFLAAFFLLMVAVAFTPDYCYSQSNLWGLTSGGGVNFTGVLFNYDLVGNNYTDKIELVDPSGDFPNGSLMRASDGNLYGMTSNGGANGAGVIFQYNINSNTYIDKFDFSVGSGDYPSGSLIQASDGNLYGMTYMGGANGLGGIFQYIISTNTYTIMKDFTGTTGINPGGGPYGSLMQASDGNLYGMTGQGGTNDLGVIFQYNIGSNTYTKKIDLSNSTGYRPFGSLIQANDGNLYGMTQSGGGIFQYIISTNTYTIMKYFTGITGINPGGSPYGSLIQASDGNLYGMTFQGGANNVGVIFQYNYSTNTYIKKIDLSSANGDDPYGSLMQASDGNLYGMTYYGGVNNRGVIFQYIIATNTYTKKIDLTDAFGDQVQWGSLIEVNLCTAPTVPIITASSTTNCGTQSTTLSISTGTLNSAANWKWYSGSCGGTAVGTGTTITVSPTATTTYYARGEGGCVTPGSCGNITITVNQVPAQPGIITGNINPCYGTTQTYSVTPVTGATGYIWTTPMGWIGTSVTNSITVTIMNSSGNITVKAVDACGNSIAQTLAVTVSHVPVQPGLITGPTSVCAGSTQTYFIAPVIGASNYTWTLSNGMTGASLTTSISITFGASGGNIIVKANNACGAGPARTLFVAVINAPPLPGIITGNISVCQGTSQTYSIAPVTGATSYTWTLPNGWTGTSLTNTIPVTVGTIGGIVSVTASNICGTSAATTLAVTVNPLPSTPGLISGNNSVCQGTTQTYSISGVTGANSYSWTLPLGWTGTSNTTSINAIAGANGGNITVIAYNSCGSVTSSPLVVTVNNAPAQPGLISGNTSVCQGASQTYFVAPVTGAISYTWTLPSGWSGSSITPSINATVGSNGGTISVTATNACGTSTASTLAVTINTTPAQPGIISGNISICLGGSQSYSILPVTGATSYNWTLPSGWTGSSTSPSINATVGANSGTISVTATNACGTSAASTLAVTVSTSIPATPGTLTGSLTPCWNTSQSYSVASVTGATSYLWSTPNGWTGTSTTNSITVTPNNQTNNFNVRAVNGCGSSAPEIITVTIAHNLPQPSLISGPTPICKGSTQTYSVLNDPNATSYTWTLPNGWTGISSTSSITVTAGQTFSGNISVNANNSCLAGPIRALWVNLIQVTPVTISGVPGNFNFCAEIAPLSVTLTASSGYSPYLWSTTETTPAITVTSANTYTVTATDPSTGCTTTASKIVTNNCALPTSLNSLYIIGGKEKLTWIQSQCAVSYTLQVCTNSSFTGITLLTHNNISPTNNNIFTGLLLNTQYFWRIQTNCNTSGTVNSGYSTPQTFTTGNPRMAEEGNAVLAFNIYPNPADKVVTISFSNTTEGDYTIKLIDVMGRVIKSETGNATTGDNAHIMNLDGIAKGIYMVILQKGDSISKSKLVVQ